MSCRVIKIIVGGEGGVGKTTLLYSYKTGEFISDTSMTVGLEFFSVDYSTDDNDYILQVWDLGGQERFRFLHDRFNSGSRGALLLFDLTSNLSFQGIKDWVHIMRAYEKEVPILLVACKLDLEYDILINDERISEIKEQYGFIDCIKTSAKTGENVNKIFDKLIANILERME